MRRSAPLALSLSLASSALLAQSATPALHWGPAPAVFPKGAQMAVVSGDPSKSAMFTIELAMPAGHRIRPHFHPTDEHVTTKEGTFLEGRPAARQASRLLDSGRASPERPTLHPAQGAS